MVGAKVLQANTPPGNIGVFQGSPFSAQLTVIYAYNVTNEYNNTIEDGNAPRQLYNFRNEKLVRKWTIGKILNGKHPKYLCIYNDNLTSPTLSQTIEQTLLVDDK